MKTFLTQICLTKNGVYSSYTHTQKGRRAVQTAGVMFLVAVAFAAPLSSAQAGICQGSKPDVYSIVRCSGDPKRECYPAWRHGIQIVLRTGSSSARAYAHARLDVGDYILSIDRSRAEFNVDGCTTPECFLDNKWPWTHQVAAAGGWDYCETRVQCESGGCLVATPLVDGYKHAVRVCLRRNGDIQCTNTWYSDQDR